jgi:1-deoxy-D-xylulose-5-phosphate synthase
MNTPSSRLLDGIRSPADLKPLTFDQLRQVAAEIRDDIEIVTHRTGGHLGSALGVVELTLALHRVFDFAKDRLIWDVSHQVYPHKLITGRRERFHTLRQFGGLSGFANPAESPYDVYMFGHAGTAVSTALGVAAGDAQRGTERRVVAVVGDGSMTCGVAYEGLNNAGFLKKNLLVILNDNRWSISQTVGALSKYLDRIRTAPIYREAKEELRHLIEMLPIVGQPMEKALETAAHAVKGVLKGVNIFEELGFRYYGPIDGHNLEAAEKSLQAVRDIPGPVLLHVLTEKGHGHTGADTDPQRAHAAKVGAAPVLRLAGPAPAQPTVEACKIEPPAPVRTTKTWTQVFAESAIDLAKKDRRVLALNAAMPEGTGLSKFEKEIPERYYDVAICEQHGVAFASGLALAGNRPIAAIYSTFLQRAFDQIMHEVCLQNLPVIFCLDRGGIAGDDGPTHHGVFDIAYFRIFPNAVVMAPKDGHELYRMIEWAIGHEQAPVAIRYPRANVPDGEEVLFKSPIRLGEAETLQEGRHGAFLAYGAMVYPALEAARRLAAQGLDVSVINARFAKPVDEELVARLCAEQPWVLTLEDHVLAGGFGSAVLEAASRAGADSRKIARLGIPDRFVEHGARPTLLESLGLDAAGIVRSALNCRAGSPA